VEAIGPILRDSRDPFADLSRAATADDIVTRWRSRSFKREAVMSFSLKKDKQGVVVVRCGRAADRRHRQS